jgi:steroid delta-isomerase-like uncharacterized protein
LAGFNSTITGLIRPHMKAEDVTQRYHDSWNKRDADALVGAFIEGGTYRSPDTPPEGVSGQDFAAFVKGVWTVFPDLSVEVIEAGEIRAGVVAHEWIVRGTNSGPGADDKPPSGRSVTLRGASIFHLEGDKIRSEEVYFDRKGLDKQLGLV